MTGLDGGPRLLSEETLTDAVREVSAGPTWQGYDLGQRWGSGFLLDSERPRPMLGGRSFGNDGAAASSPSATTSSASASPTWPTG
ncbi:hypothetical protein ACFQVA_20125 [Actinomadura keratinilytica]